MVASRKTYGWYPGVVTKPVKPCLTVDQERMRDTAFYQCYFEGRPVLPPLYADSLLDLPIVRAGNTPMLEMHSGKYNVDCVVYVDHYLRHTVLHNVRIVGTSVYFEEA